MRIYLRILLINISGKFNPPTKSPNCVDIDEECVRWAKNGYCTAVQQKHLDIMRNKCCKSCKGIFFGYYYIPRN